MDLPIKTEYKTLEASLCIPSAIHGYSLAVEYMKEWFLDKFDKNYFKTIFINGKHILDDYRRFSIGDLIKREKPAVAITPVINLEYDRNMQDSYMGGKDIIIAKFNHEKSFLKDYERGIFLGLNLRQLEVGFNFKVRVSTKAQQIDLYRHMEMAFRIGYTQYEYIAVDFHIPMELMLNIACHAGFTIENDKIVDLIGFVNYLNSISEFPITYKLRTINGNNEFFLRVPNVYVHISCLDKLQADDGEREGATDNNFHVEMNAVLKMMVPHYYVYKSIQKMVKFVPTLDSNVFGIYTFKVFDIPEVNSKKWNKYIITAYEFDKEELYQQNIQIDISKLFNKEMRKVIDKHIQMGISPALFMEIVLYNYDADSECTVDWINLKIIVPKAISGRIHIAIYLDHNYYNSQKI